MDSTTKLTDQWRKIVYSLCIANLPETIGKAYAHFQHGLDRAIGWGFEKMRDADRPVKEPSGKIVGMGKKALSFFGRAGDAYYKAYDELKRQK